MDFTVEQPFGETDLYFGQLNPHLVDVESSLRLRSVHWVQLFAIKIDQKSSNSLRLIGTLEGPDPCPFVVVLREGG